MRSNLAYVDKIIETEIIDFSAHFLRDYCGDKGKKRDNIPNKKNNIFIAALGNDVTIYSALMRSLDSSLGNRIEKIAKLIAEQNYVVKNKIEGYISKDSIEIIANLLDKYENHGKKPEDKDIEAVYKK
ncbi:MAG: TdeIII family type II restriction endonuclease, partial [Patescibacteria group bacterium]